MLGVPLRKSNDLIIIFKLVRVRIGVWLRGQLVQISHGGSNTESKRMTGHSSS